MLIFLLSVSGCATVMRHAFDDNPDSCDMPPYVYGGTALDWHFVTGPGQGKGYEKGDLVMRAFGLINLPFSLLGDTILLPVLCLCRLKKKAE